MTTLELEKDQVYYFICAEAFEWKQGCDHLVLGAVEWLGDEIFDFDIFMVLKGCRHWRAGTRVDMDSIKPCLKEYHPEQERRS